MIETIIGASVGFVIGYFTSYFKQKGKNKAIKEDIKSITYEKESISSTFKLDIEKRKALYEGKKEQYLKYFNLLDKFSSEANLQGTKIIVPLISKFTNEYIQSLGNKTQELAVAGNFSEAINIEMNKSNEQWKQIKNETNTIRLIANTETIELLDQMESLYKNIFEQSGQVFKKIPEMIVLKQTDKLKGLLEEYQNIGNEINSTKTKLIQAMRSDLNEI